MENKLTTEYLKEVLNKKLSKRWQKTFNEKDIPKIRSRLLQLFEKSGKKRITKEMIIASVMVYYSEIDQKEIRRLEALVY